MSAFCLTLMKNENENYFSGNSAFVICVRKFLVVIQSALKSVNRVKAGEKNGKTDEL